MWEGIWFQILKPKTEKIRFLNWVRVITTTAAFVIAERSCRHPDYLLLNLTVLLRQRRWSIACGDSELNLDTTLDSAHVSMSPWNCSAVLDGQLYTHSRSHWPSAPAFCHSAEVGRTALSIEQFRSSALFCGGPVDLEFAARQSSWPSLSLDTFKRRLKTYIFAKYWWQNVLSALEIFLSMRYINLHFTYLLTYLPYSSVVGKDKKLHFCSNNCKFPAEEKITGAQKIKFVHKSRQNISFKLQILYF